MKSVRLFFILLIVPIGTILRCQPFGSSKVDSDHVTNEIPSSSKPSSTSTPKPSATTATTSAPIVATSVVVTAGVSTVVAAQTIQFQATLNYSDGTSQNVSSTAAWSVNNTNATINSSGLLTGEAPGSSVVTATYAGISGTFNVTVTAYLPTAISSLRLWLDASSLTSLYQDNALTTPVTTSGQTVGGWKDLSGNAYHLTQPAGGNRPTYLTNQTTTNQPCLSLGGSHSLDITSLLGMVTGDPRTFIAVGKISNTANARESFFSQNQNGSPGNYISFDSRTWPGGNPFFALYFSSATYESNFALDTQLHVFRAGYLNTTVGASRGINTNITYKIDSTVTTLTLAAGNPTIDDYTGIDNSAVGRIGTTYMNGLVCEVLVFKQPPSAAEETYLFNTLKAKWGTP